MRRARLDLLLLLSVLAVCSCHDRSAAINTPAEPRSVVSPPLTEPSEASCRKFVQAFYDWYTSPISPDKQHPDGHLFAADALRLKRQLFDGKLYQLLKEDEEAEAKNSDEIVGLDFDPFLNSQDPSPKFQVQSVAMSGNACKAQVRGVYSGQLGESVNPELVKRDGNWIFVNFYYPVSQSAQDENLISLLNGYRAERKQPDAAHK